MRMPRVTLLAGLLIVTWFSAADARCRPVLDCSRRPCQQVQECDSALDDSGTRLPLQPPGGRQRAPSVPERLVPESIPVMPPRNTSGCRQAYVCDGGRCSWQVLCQ
jgi:hypothetical protein